MAFKLLNGVTATGESESITFTKLVKDHSIQVAITGAPTVVTVNLEGSLNDTDFFQIATHTLSAGELTAEGALFHVENKVIRNVRLNLITLTGGTAPTVTAIYEGFEDRS